MHREPGARKERGEGGLCAREPRGRHHPVKGRDVSSQYGGMDETCPLCTGGRGGGGAWSATQVCYCGTGCQKAQRKE